ncbi:MAG: hypothetical protein FWH36_00780 [Lentimicrobiaceae bacterium]|nr:hypothetical protein [Lentimicrobiaceae bacterium]
MQKTDIFGKKPYRNVEVKQLKPFLEYCYVLAVRTDADMLSFSKIIYAATNYLFYISPLRFQFGKSDKSPKFQSFIYKDIVTNYKLFYLQNTDFQSNTTILGYGEDALFQLKQQVKKSKNQATLSLEDENDTTQSAQDENSEEVKDWKTLKANLTKNSVNIMGKIDYLFPIQIETYEILMPLLQHFPKMQRINYMLIEPKQINDAISFFTHIDLMEEQINLQNKNEKLTR